MMRYRLVNATFTILFTLLVAPTARAEVTIPPPDIKAKGYILVDFASGSVLAEKNADKRLEPASLTKIMTAHVVFREIEEGNLKLDEKTTVSKNAWRTKGSRMFIQVGTRVSIKELLMGLII